MRLVVVNVAVTEQPAVGQLVDATGGSTLDANVALAVNNARVAAELASALVAGG